MYYFTNPLYARYFFAFVMEWFPPCCMDGKCGFTLRYETKKRIMPMKIFRTATLSLMALPMMLNAAGDAVRTDSLFNFGWRFALGSHPEAVAPAFDDSGWRGVDIPHDYQIELPYDSLASRGRGFKPMAEGWYRKSFPADPSWDGRRVILDFEGIMLHGRAWVNGVEIGATPYGYLGFEADITPLLRTDTLNVVTVSSSTGDAPDSRWYTGGGLFRNVRLEVRDTVSVSRHGLHISTPEITPEAARVAVTVEIDGLKGRDIDMEIRATVLDPAGREVASASVAAPRKSRQPSVEVGMPLMTVDSPMLWDCDNPHLYTAVVELVRDGRVTDRVSDRFGIRTVEFTQAEGLKLNGKKVFLKGVANHHDLGALGAAAFPAGIGRMMDRLKEFGFNHIRTSHNPYSEDFLRLADEKGLLIVNELYDKWSNTVAWAGDEPWTNIWYQNIIEWVKRDRNHPSVIMWSLGNELQFQEERCGFPTRDWGVTAYRMMDVLVKRFDPTRATTVAMYPARAGGIVKHSDEFRIPENIVPPELATVTDVASFNYCWDDYQKYLEKAPHMIMYQSEAVTNELTAPYYGMDRDKMVGLAYWGAIEYWGESNRWPKKGWDYSFFNHSLEPYPQAYLIKASFDESVPQVHIGVVDSEGEAQLWNDIVVGQKKISSHWNRDKGERYTVYTYTNCDSVELRLNGHSLGRKANDISRPRRNIIEWRDVEYTPGKLTAVAWRDGYPQAEHTIATTGKPVGLRLETENPDWRADGMDLQYVRIYAVDSKGRKVPTAAGDVKVSVEGNATLLALDNGNHSSDDTFAGDTRALHRGFAMAILRSTTESGPVSITVTSGSLKGKKLNLNTK